MTRLPNPIEQQQLKGADRKNPQRYRKEIAKSDADLGNAPEHMNAEAKACWFEISSYAIPGVLTGAERIPLEMLANLLAEYRQNPSEFATAKLTQMISILARFGMTPSDRTKLGVDKNKDDDPYSRLDD